MEKMVELEACSDYRERQNIRCALREIKGLGFTQNTIPTYSSFPRHNSLKSQSERYKNSSSGYRDKVDVIKSRDRDSSYDNKTSGQYKKKDNDFSLSKKSDVYKERDKDYSINKKSDKDNDYYYLRKSERRPDRRTSTDSEKKSPDRYKSGEKGTWGSSRRKNLKCSVLDESIDKDFTLKKYFEANGEIDADFVDEDLDKEWIKSGFDDTDDIERYRITGTDKSKDTIENSHTKPVGNKGSNSFRSYLSVGSLNTAKESSNSPIKERKEGTFRAKKINISRSKVKDKTDTIDKSTETEEGVNNTSKEDISGRGWHDEHRIRDRVLTPTKWKSADNLTNRNTSGLSNSSLVDQKSEKKEQTIRPSKLVSNIINHFESQEEIAAIERHRSLKSSGSKSVIRSRSVNARVNNEPDDTVSFRSKSRESNYNSRSSGIGERSRSVNARGNSSNDINDKVSYAKEPRTNHSNSRTSAKEIREDSSNPTTPIIGEKSRSVNAKVHSSDKSSDRVNSAKESRGDDSNTRTPFNDRKCDYSENPPRIYSRPPSICDINDTKPVNETSSPRLNFLKNLGSRVISSPRKPRKIVSYRTSAFSVGSKANIEEPVESRARLQSAPPVIETDTQENSEIKSESPVRIHAKEKLKPRIKSEESYKMKEQTQVSCDILENSLLVSPVSENVGRKVMAEIIESVDTKVDNDVFKEGTDNQVSVQKKKGGLSRKSRVESDEKNCVKKYRKKTADSEDCDKSRTESKSVSEMESVDPQVPKSEVAVDRKFSASENKTIPNRNVTNDLSANKKGIRTVRRKLPEIPVKVESDGDDEESIHERTLRLLRERKERLEKLTLVKETPEKEKIKMSPADLKKSLEEKLESTESKKKAVRMRRELQLLNRESELKAVNSGSNSESESTPVVKPHLTKEDKEIASLTTKMDVRTNSEVGNDKSRAKASVQRSKSDVVKCRRAISETEDMFGSKGDRDYKGAEELLKGQENITPVDKINMIGSLMQEEAKLQDMLRKSSNFSEKRKMRADIKHIRQKRIVFDDAPKTKSKRSLEDSGDTPNHLAAVRRCSSVTVTTTSHIPTDLPLQGDITDIHPTIDDLRRQLSETQDYDEKKKIRLAMRQLRQQSRDAGISQPGLQRSQSFVHRKSSEPVFTHDALTNGLHVNRSQSVTDKHIADIRGFSAKIDKENSYDDKHNSSDSSKSSYSSSKQVVPSRREKQFDISKSDISKSDIPRPGIPKSSDIPNKDKTGHSTLTNGDKHIGESGSSILNKRYKQRDSIRTKEGSDHTTLTNGHADDSVIESDNYKPKGSDKRDSYDKVKSRSYTPTNKSSDLKSNSVREISKRDTTKENSDHLQHRYSDLSEQGRKSRFEERGRSSEKRTEHEQGLKPKLHHDNHTKVKEEIIKPTKDYSIVKSEKFENPLKNRILEKCEIFENGKKESEFDKNRLSRLSGQILVSRADVEKSKQNRLVSVRRNRSSSEEPRKQFERERDKGLWESRNKRDWVKEQEDLKSRGNKESDKDNDRRTSYRESRRDKKSDSVKLEDNTKETVVKSKDKHDKGKGIAFSDKVLSYGEDKPRKLSLDVNKLENGLLNNGLDAKVNPNLAWLQEKRKSVPNPHDIEKLMSTMEIEAAFSEILDAVEKFPEEKSVVESVSGKDAPILEEGSDSSGMEEDLNKNNKGVPNHELITHKEQNEGQGEDSGVENGENEMENMNSDNVDGKQNMKCDNLDDKQSAIKEPQPTKSTDNKESEKDKLMLAIPPPTADANSSVSVIHGDDGTVTVQEINKTTEGDTTITEWKKLRRTQSKTETRETDTVIEKKVSSPGGTSSVYEKDVSKTKSKLTSRGSLYYSKNHLNVRKKRDLEGTEIVDHELNAVSENMSVSKNEMWGDKMEAKVILNKDLSSELSTMESIEDNSGGNKWPLLADRQTSSTDEVVKFHLGKPQGCPEITSPLSETSVMEGNSVTFDCTIVCSPDPTVLWFKGDNQVRDGDHGVRVIYNGESGKASLQIARVALNDAAMYRCDVINALGKASTSAQLTVKKLATTLPTFLINLTNQTVREGQALTLQCDVKEGENVTWLKDGVIIHNNADFKQTFDGTTAKLEMIEAFIDDDGTYTCLVKNSFGESKCSCQIVVKEAECNDNVVPMFLKKPETQIVDERDTVILECEVIGSPQPSISWFCDRSKFIEGQRHRMSYDGRVAMLVIRKVTLQENGKIEVVVENSAGRVTADCLLVVKASKASVTFTKPLSNTVATSGESAILECEFPADASPQIAWRKNGLVIGQMFDFKQTYIGGVARLEISNCCAQDCGKYECVASVNNGEIITSCELIVQEPKPKPVEVPKQSKVEPQVTHKEETIVVKDPAIIVSNKTVKSSVPKIPEEDKVPLVSVTMEKETPSEEKEPKVSVSEDKVQTASKESFRSEYVATVTEENKNIAKSQVSKLIEVRGGSFKKENDKAVKEVAKVKIDEYNPEVIYIAKDKIGDKVNESDKTHISDSGNKSSEISDSAKESSTEDDTSLKSEHLSDPVKPKFKPLATFSDEESNRKLNKSNEINEPKGEIRTKGEESDKKDDSSLLKHNKDTVVDVNSNIPMLAKAAIDAMDCFVKAETKGEVKFEDKSKVEAKAKSEEKIELKELPPPNVMCVEVEKPKLVNKFKSGEIRRTQSTRVPGSEKPEWLQVKLRKVGSNQSPFVIPEKNKTSVKSEVVLSDSDNPNDQLVEPKPVIKVENTAAKVKPVSTDSDKLVSEKRDVKLSRSQSARVSDRSIALKDSTKSRVYSNKDSIKLTPVSERARLFQRNESSPPTGNQSPVEIISKAINLSRAESMKAPVGHRFSSVQKSSSFRTADEKRDITQELSSQIGKGDSTEKSDSGPARRKVVKYWDPSAPSQSKMDYSKITDEEELNNLLSASDNFDERKKIRSRIKEIRDAHMIEGSGEEWEARQKAREAEQEDVIKRKHREADAEKQRKLEAYQKQAAEKHEAKHLDMAEQHLKDRIKAADEHKKRAMEEFSGRGAVHHESKHLEVSEKALQEKLKQADLLKQKTLDSYDKAADGKTTTTTRRVETVTKVGGAGRPAGRGGAMNQFKQMDAQNNPNAGKTNPLVAYTYAKRAASTMKRNAVAIKQEILNFCTANTKEYETIEITNFSTSWNDGIAFCALIHHFYPESFDFKALNPKQRRKNFELAFDTAEKYADIAPLLDVEDMVRMQKPDWKCVFTYVQSFYRKLRDHDKNKVAA